VAVHRLVLAALGIAPEVELAAPLAFASADLVRERAPKAVKAAETLDFKTLVPVPGGLFDYKVFGPGTVIDAPAIVDDEPIKPRKTEFARISLAMPVLHALACDRTPQELVDLAGLNDKARDCTKLLDDPQLYTDVIAGLELNGHGSLVLRELPVLPPDLRPLRRLDDDRWAVSPINDLYRRALTRNSRLAHVVETNAPEVILASERQQLHTAILQLFDGESALRSICGGNDSFAAALRELDHHTPGTELTGKLYRANAVLFALAFTRDSVPNDASREAAA
jgi:DNA-directed RNA polymerase beta' subunit